MMAAPGTGWGNKNKPVYTMGMKRPGGDYDGQSQRRALLKALLIITALCGMLFFVINSRRGVMILAYLELGAAVASWRSISWFAVRHGCCSGRCFI